MVYTPIMQNGRYKLILLILLSITIIFASQSIANEEAVAVDTVEEHVYDSINSADLSGEEPVRAGEEEVEAETLVETTYKEPPTLLDFLLTGKYLAFFILSIIALALLTGNWINYWVRLFLLVVAFVLFGLDYIYPLHPSPMCGIPKLIMFKFTWGKFFPAFVAIFVAIFLPSFIGRKLFCGWVCPLGALQDLINKIPHKWHYKNFSFSTFNGIRTALFLMFILVFFGVIDHLAWLAKDMQIDPTVNTWIAYSAYSIYEPINFFELLHWNLNTTFYIMFPILVIASLVLYRPFCYMICPIGFLTWLVERISPGRIRIDHSTCNDCGICYEESPCPTIKPLVEGKMMIPDCTSCGECISTCPKGSISFGFLPKPSRKDHK